MKKAEPLETEETELIKGLWDISEQFHDFDLKNQENKLVNVEMNQMLGMKYHQKNEEQDLKPLHT